MAKLSAKDESAFLDCQASAQTDYRALTLFGRTMAVKLGPAYEAIWNDLYKTSCGSMTTAGNTAKTLGIPSNPVSWK